MAEYLKSDVKVGGVILFCVLLLTGLIFYVGGFKNLENQYMLRILADSAYGVGKSSVVTYSGVKAGEVLSLRVMAPEEIKAELARLNDPKLAPDDLRVEMILKVSESAVLRADSKAEVVGSGLVGDQIVNLTPGSFDAPRLPEGTTLVGVELTGLGKLQKGIGKVDFDVLIPNIRKTVMNLTEASEKVNHTVERLDKFVAELEKKDQVNKILDETQELVTDLKKTVSENSPKVTEALSNFSEASAALKTELQPTLASIREFSENLNKLVSENKDDLDQMVSEMKSTAINFNQFSEKVKKYPWTVLKKTKVDKGDERLFPSSADVKFKEASPRREKKDKVFLFF